MGETRAQDGSSSVLWPNAPPAGRVDGTTGEQRADQDRKPAVDVSEPQTVPGDAVEDHLLGGITQKGSPTGHLSQHAILAFCAQILLDVGELGHQQTRDAD